MASHDALPLSSESIAVHWVYLVSALLSLVGTIALFWHFMTLKNKDLGAQARIHGYLLFTITCVGFCYFGPFFFIFKFPYGAGEQFYNLTHGICAAQGIIGGYLLQVHFLLQCCMSVNIASIAFIRNPRPSDYVPWYVGLSLGLPLLVLVPMIIEHDTIGNLGTYCFFRDPALIFWFCYFFMFLAISLSIIGFLLLIHRVMRLEGKDLKMRIIKGYLPFLLWIFFSWIWGLILREIELHNPDGDHKQLQGLRLFHLAVNGSQFFSLALIVIFPAKLRALNKE